jgi:hypothetical protein
MERQNRDGPHVQCDVVAVDLVAQKLVFRHQVQTHGLLNVISAPHLSEASTYIAQSTAGGHPIRPAVAAEKQQKLPVRRADVTMFQTTSTDMHMVVEDGSAVVDSHATLASRVAPQWSEAWLDRQLDSTAVSSQWPSSMPRMNMRVKLTALGSSVHPRHNASPGEPPVYVHLGKVPAELLDPVKVCLAAEWLQIQIT